MAHACHPFNSIYIIHTSSYSGRYSSLSHGSLSNNSTSESDSEIVTADRSLAANVSVAELELPYMSLRV